MILFGSKGCRICSPGRYRLFRRSCWGERGGVHIEFTPTSTRLLLLGMWVVVECATYETLVYEKLTIVAPYPYPGIDNIHR